MSYIIQREYWFSAAHRLEGHPKCGRLHGHNYKVQVYLQRSKLTEGMVLDFGLLDRAVKPVIDELDHKYMITETNRASNDPYAVAARDNGHAVDLPIMYSTAEMLSEYLAEEIKTWIEDVEEIPHTTVQVWVWETVRSAATHTS
jgi:6-pyruvoyl tetrahydropterin synthase/QueD family protein